MRDFTKEVRAALLGACPRVFFYYPNDFTTMPAISYYDNLNSSADGSDLLTNLGFQIDVWSKNVDDCKAITAAADTAMRSLGFRRSFSQQITDPSNGYRHQSMRFEGTYNALDQKIYSRS